MSSQLKNALNSWNFLFIEFKLIWATDKCCCFMFNADPLVLKNDSIEKIVETEKQHVD